MYPLGFVSIVGFLEQHGYSVRIINLAVKMLKNRDFDVESLIERLNADVFGFDLHWLAHAAGSLDIASLVKKHHPNRPILLGGLSATYYHEEIIKHFPQIDYILRGDTTEKPLLQLMSVIESDKEPNGIPNLTWRTKEGKINSNPLSFVPDNIDDIWFDYGQVVKMVLKHRDLESTLPYESFMDYPFTAVFTCKGCSYNCITCGGSCYTFKNFFNRNRIVMKSPGKLVEEMTIISEYFKAPLFVIGDIQQGGVTWSNEVLDRIKEAGLDNTITFEFFNMPSKKVLNRIANSTNSWTIEVSPESHDDEVRKIMGKPYTSEQMEKTIKNALNLGAEKIDVYYMVGLSGQTMDSVFESVAYNEKLFERATQKEKIFPFIAPMAPFLDPGSMIFENPSKYGFHSLYRTLRDHKEALYQPSWKLYLSYYTEWMTRDQIVETTYEAVARMNAIKIKYGVIDPTLGKRINTGLKMSKEITRKIDNIIAKTKTQKERNKRYQELKQEIDEAIKNTSLGKKELRMPGLAGFRFKGAIKHILKSLRLLG
jgi:B12-binding domain/radical SAM domain protein